jgi:hypothetical protein
MFRRSYHCLALYAFLCPCLAATASFAAGPLPGPILHAAPDFVMGDDGQANATQASTPAIAAFGQAEPVDCCDAPYAEDLCPCWYGEGEWLLLQRTRGTTSQPILMDDNTGNTLLSTNDLGFGFSSGARAIAGKRFCDNLVLEFGYLGWFDGHAVTGKENTDPDVVMALPDALSGLNVFYGLNRLRVDYGSRINSFEFNLARCCQDSCNTCRSLEWFAGVRYVRLDESLRIDGEREQDGEVESGVYAVRTANNLYGGQLGGRLRRGWGRWRWEGTAKAGVFWNDAAQTQWIIDYPDFPARPTTGGGAASLAFVGELNLSAIYRLNDVWGLRTGYNLIWVQGVALAPDQLDFTYTPESGSRLAHDAGFLLHGFNVGVEARW